jgi:hypothetical protein
MTRILPALFATLIATSLAAVPGLGAAAAVEERIAEFSVVSLSASAPERTLLATLQGLANRERFRLWIRTAGLGAHVLDELAVGATVHELGSVWDALRAFRDDVDGFVVFDAGTLGIDIATSLCGPLRAVAVERSLVARAEAAGLKQLADARGMDQLAVWDRYRERFARGMLVEQDPAKEWHLRDFAVARSAFTFWGLPDADVRRLLRESGPATTVFGWGPDERRAVTLASEAGGGCIASDWSANLSALAKLPVALPPRPLPPPPAPPAAGERIVAFVMSDGDNLCFVGGTFADDHGFFGSPRRGAFSMTWEMAPCMAELHSRGLRWFYRAASAGPAWDDFVMGPSGAVYCFPSRVPDRGDLARRTAACAAASGLGIVSLLDDGGGMEQADELLDQPAIDGVLYKGWVPYNARHGAVHWHHGKPCVSYRYLLWEGMAGQDPAGVAAAIAAQPSAPGTDPDSYALINVHAWSWRALGGPMEAVKQTIDLLPPKTRVVTARELIGMMGRELGGERR